jgi:KDO2-lipid IV(A) lauroyltransferase
VYLASLAAIWLIRFLPYPLVVAFFRFFGILVFLVDAFHRKVATIQIRAALGIANPWRIVMKVFMNLGVNMVDTIRYVYMSDEEVKARVVVEGKEHLEEALASGRGLMLYSGHIGNWEILFNAARVLDFQFCIMVNIRKTQILEKIIGDIRSYGGVTLLPPTGMLDKLINTLKEGKVVGIIIDGRGEHKRDLYCDVFGMPAPTKSAPAYIALQGNALVMPVHIMKVKGTYHWYFGKAVDTAQFGEGDEAIRKLSDIMQSWVASVIREHPDQWFWIYSRWLKRSEMRRVIKKKLNFKEYVFQTNLGDNNGSGKVPINRSIR